MDELLINFFDSEEGYRIGRKLGTAFCEATINFIKELKSKE